MKTRKPQQERTIQVLYFRWGKQVRSVKFTHLANACGGCFKNMERNHYQATTAQVVDLITGAVYLTVYLTVEGNIFSFYGPGAKKKIRENLRLIKALPGEEPPEGTSHHNEFLPHHHQGV